MLSPGEGDTSLGTFAFTFNSRDGFAEMDSLVPNLTQKGFTHIVKISDDNDLGQLVGTALRADGSTEGVILTPIPEASATAAILSAVALCLRARGRQKRK